MARNIDDQSAIKRYLLGQLSDDEQREIEFRLLSDEDFLEELEIVEDELIDEYLESTLSAEQRLRFEKHFLASPERKQRLASATAQKRYFSRVAPLPSPRAGSLERLGNWLQKSLLSSPIAVTAIVLIVAVLGFLVWRGGLYESDEDKALVALNNAYQRQRPLEARITKLQYAPLVTTRGPGVSEVDANELTRAQVLLLQRVHEKPTPAALHALGRVFLTTKDFDRAIEQFQEALKGDSSNAQIYADLGAAYLEKGKIEIHKSGADQKNQNGGNGLAELGLALENLNKALNFKPNLLEALFNRALCKQSMTLYAQAEEDWRQYLQRDSTSPWAEEARQNLKSLEDRRTRASESTEQLRLQFSQAFDFKNEDAAWMALSRSQSRAGNLIVEKLLDDYLNLRVQGQPEEASRALQLIVYAGDVETKKANERYTSDLAKIYANGGMHQWLLLAMARQQMKLAIKTFYDSEFDSARELSAKAEAAFVKVNDGPEALLARSWVGYSSLRIPKPEEGIAIFEELSGKFAQRGYKFFEASALTALGDANSGLNEFSKTLDYANRCLEASQQVDDTANSLRCLSQRASTHLILNNKIKSLDSFLRATVLAENLPPDARLVWPLYYEAALNFHLLSLPSSALAFGQEAMALANAADSPLLRSRSLERLGVIYGEQGNFVAAIDSGKRAVAEAQSIAGESSRKSLSAHATLILAELYANSGDANKGIQNFDESIGLYDALGLEAYSYRAHKGKLLALMSSDNAAANAELEMVLQLFEAQRSKIIEESNRDKFFDSGQDTYDVAIDFVVSRNNDYIKAFEYAEASRARSLLEMMSSGVRPMTGLDGKDLALRAETVPLAAYQIQKDMPPGAQLLEYAVLKDKVVMWVVTPSAINGAQVLLNSGELEQSVRRYVSLLADGNKQSVTSGEIRSDGLKLHEKLIAPIERFLDPKLPLAIVPDKSLNYLPFAAVLTSSGKYLIEDFEVEQSPSAAVFVRSSAAAALKARATPETLLSIGNPEFDRSQYDALADLPAAATEAKEIASFYRSATLLTGKAASRDRIIRGLAGADVVHFATHAVADDTSPLDSKIVLASDGNSSAGSNGTDGAFEAFDIYGLQPQRARLVVLSACQTGIERSYKGEGAIGLARPFIAVGVPLVIASLWPVESNATADLMISFHRYRKVDRLSTISALRRAQLDMIHHTAPGEIAYGWAAFTAIGGYAAY
ncbi:MAG TPA: CHAT domain-containing protein [Pyrinomonadaceae bacterium]|nr:CHAT domain-containing protein [Pyrinomonadaceae bacterium]